MTLRPSLDPSGNVNRLFPEFFILRREKISFDLVLVQWNDTQKKCESIEGFLVLSNLRLVLVSTNSSKFPEIKGIDFPLTSILSVQFESPLFGADRSYIKVSPMDKNEYKEIMLTIFSSSGSFEIFRKVLEEAISYLKQMTLSNSINDNIIKMYASGQYQKIFPQSSTKDCSIFMTAQPQWHGEKTYLEMTYESILPGIGATSRFISNDLNSNSFSPSKLNININQNPPQMLAQNDFALKPPQFYNVGDSSFVPTDKSKEALYIPSEEKEIKKIPEMKTIPEMKNPDSYPQFSYYGKKFGYEEQPKNPAYNPNLKFVPPQMQVPLPPQKLACSICKKQTNASEMIFLTCGHTVELICLINMMTEYNTLGKVLSDLKCKECSKQIDFKILEDADNDVYSQFSIRTAGF